MKACAGIDPCSLYGRVYFLVLYFRFQIGFLKEVGMKLTEVSSRGVHGMSAYSKAVLVSLTAFAWFKTMQRKQNLASAFGIQKENRG